MAPPRMPSIVNSATAVVTAVRHQRQESHQVFDNSATQTRQWLAVSIEACKQQILAGSGRANAAANNESSKPAAKKLKSSNSETDNVLSMETIGAVKALKVKELANRLKERGLNVVGVKKVLRRRLLEAMASEVLAQTAKSSFTSAAGAKESVEHNENENENENTNQMQESPQTQHEPVPKQEQSPVDHHHPVVAAPLSPEYVEPVDAPEEDPMEMEDEEEEEEAQALAEDHNLDDSGLVDLTEDLAVDDDSDSEDAVAPVISDEASDMSMIDAPPQQQEQPAASMQHVDVQAPVVRAVKTSRSPLKRVQSGVQSAINMFSKSPAKVTWSASKKKSPVYLSENQSAKTEGENECESIEDVPMSTDGQDLENDSESEPEEAPKANEAGKAHVRQLNTAAIGGSLYRSLSSEASGNKPGGTSALSSIVKAKNEARKAKLAEIRNKSKPVASSKPLAPAQPLSSFKAGGNATLAESKDGKRKLLAAQMREKAAIKFNKKNEMPVKATASTQQVDAPPSVKPIEPSGKLASSTSENRTPAEHESKKTAATPASTNSQQSVLSPLDTYEMSDREQSESDSESENETRKDKKRVPSWAQKLNLIPALEKQYTAKSSKFDPDEIFGEVQTCDLQAIFDQKKARYQRRTSSGNWNQDRATAAEKLTYKRKLGFTAKA